MIHSQAFFDPSFDAEKVGKIHYAIYIHEEILVINNGTKWPCRFYAE